MTALDMTFTRRTISFGLGGLLFAGAAKAAAKPVQTSGFVVIGGIEQWISVRGADAANPVILVVHGGPGETQWPVADHYAPWEKAFTVVQWDQRGAGHTFARNGVATTDVDLAHITRDGIEVAEHLRATLGKGKIIVLGHSWGSIVATNMAQKRPDLFAAYVGTGQVAWLKHIRGFTPQSLGCDQQTFDAVGAGMTFTIKNVLPDMMKANLKSTAKVFKTPVFVIQGKDDITTPTAPVADYFETIVAPRKSLRLIEGAGHFAFMTHGEAFLSALEKTVRPVAVSRGA